MRSVFLLHLSHFVRARPAEPEELSSWSSLMAAYHYLGTPMLEGESLRNVVTVDDRWVVLSG